jgi:chaperone modulatory protein CbpM
METEDLIPVQEVITHHKIEVTFLDSLHEFGLIEITTVNETRFVLKEQMSELEKMIRLHYELDINLEGIEAISYLLQRVNSLQEELRAAKNRLRVYEES